MKSKKNLSSAATADWLRLLATAIDEGRLLHLDVLYRRGDLGRVSYEFLDVVEKDD